MAAVVGGGREHSSGEVGQLPERVVPGVGVAGGRGVGAVEFAVGRGDEVVLVQRIVAAVIAVLEMVGGHPGGRLDPILVDHPPEPVEADVAVAGDDGGIKIGQVDVGLRVGTL